MAEIDQDKKSFGKRGVAETMKWAGGICTLALVGSVYSVWANKNISDNNRAYTEEARNSSPINNEELQTKLGNVEGELAKTRAEYAKLQQSFESVKFEGCVIMDLVQAAQDQAGAKQQKVTCEQFLKFVEGKKAETKNLSGALNK